MLSRYCFINFIPPEDSLDLFVLLLALIISKYDLFSIQYHGYHCHGFFFFWSEQAYQESTKEKRRAQIAQGSPPTKKKKKISCYFMNNCKYGL